MNASNPAVPPPPPSAETPESPAPRLPLDVLLAPGSGWFRALRSPVFRIFWAGNFVSNIGSWMQNLAQGWLVLQLTNSPFWLGLVGFAQQVPALVFSLLGGVIADRASRRKLLLATQTTMMILALVLAVLTHLRLVTVRQIVIIAVFAGITMALNAPNYQSAIRELAPEEDILNAIALNSIQFNASRVLGPSLAGFTIAAMGTAACFYLNALSYVPLLLVIARVPFPTRASREASSLGKDLAEGFRYVWHQRTILLLVLLVGMVSMFGLPYLVMLPAFAKDVLHVGARGLGYLAAAAGAGALLGGLRLASLKSHRRRGPVLFGSALTFFAAILLFCVSRQPVVSALLLAVVGGAMVGSVATALSLIQTLVPAEIRGRVLSMHTMAYLGLTPLGSLMVGALAEKWGTPAALAASSGLALVLTSIMALAAPTLRRVQ